MFFPRWAGSGGENNHLVSPPGGSPRPLSAADVDQIAKRFYELTHGKAPQAQEQQLPGKEIPLEDVELVGEKVNYKIALNPEIFYRYSILKVKVAASGLRQPLQCH